MLNHARDLLVLFRASFFCPNFAFCYMSKALWKGPVYEKLKSTCDNLGAVYCCDRNARAACAQNFAMWQQATIEIMRRNHSIIACSRHLYVCKVGLSGYRWTGQPKHFQLSDIRITFCRLTG